MDEKMVQKNKDMPDVVFLVLSNIFSSWRVFFFNHVQILNGVRLPQVYVGKMTKVV